MPSFKTDYLPEQRFDVYGRIDDTNAQFTPMIERINDDIIAAPNDYYWRLFNSDATLSVYSDYAIRSVGVFNAIAW